MPDVPAPASSVRRRLYFVYDLSDGQGSALCAALSAHDRDAEYRIVVSLEACRPEWRSVSALLFFVTTNVAKGQETLFTEVETFLTGLGPLNIGLLTDSDDSAFLKSCYAKGISQVLQTTLSMSVIVQSLQLMAHGRAFVPVRLLISRDSDEQ